VFKHRKLYKKVLGAFIKGRKNPSSKSVIARLSTDLAMLNDYDFNEKVFNYLKEENSLGVLSSRQARLNARIAANIKHMDTVLAQPTSVLPIEEAVAKLVRINNANLIKRFTS
jgi:hypothetical protein